MGGLLLTTRMHHIPLMPPYVLPPATMQPCLAQGLGLTAANNELITSFKMGNTYLLTGSVTTPEASQIALLRVSLSRSLLSCLLQPRNLEAIKSSLPQFLNQNLAPA